MTGAAPLVETLGLARPSGDWAVIRSAARQAQVLADALEDAAPRRIGSPAPGAWEGRAASAFEATARRGRQEVLEAASGAWPRPCSRSPGPSRRPGTAPGGPCRYSPVPRSNDGFSSAGAPRTVRSIRSRRDCGR